MNKGKFDWLVKLMLATPWKSRGCCCCCKCGAVWARTCNKRCCD